MRNRRISLLDIGLDSSFDASMTFVQATLQNTAMPKDCPTPEEMDPLSGLLGVQTCTGGPGQTNFYGAGLVDALAAGSG